MKKYWLTILFACFFIQACTPEEDLDLPAINSSNSGTITITNPGDTTPSGTINITTG